MNKSTMQWLHKWLDEVLGMENQVALTLSQRRTSDVFSFVVREGNGRVGVQYNNWTIWLDR